MHRNEANAGSEPLCSVFDTLSGGLEAQASSRMNSVGRAYGQGNQA